MHDVVIVGAGIAGSATAIHLSRLGRRVLLLDRSSFPRRKACGEAVFPRGRAELGELDVLAPLEDESASLKAVRFTLDGRFAEAQIGRKGSEAIGVSRSKLDSELLDSAMRAGVDVETDTSAGRLVSADERFELEAGGKHLPGRFIVAADGLGSALRHQAGLNSDSPAHRYGVSAHVVVGEEPPPRIDIFFELGYEVYVTPVGGGLVNVAVLLNRSRVKELGGRLREGFESLIGRVPLAGGNFELVDEPLAVGPFPASASSAWRKNLVLVGDANGFFDPISGNGMSLALASARDCASAVDAHLETGSIQPLKDYEKRCRSQARNSTLLARIVLAVAARPRLGRRVLENLARRPKTFTKLAAINDGEIGLSSLRPRDVLAFVLGV